MESSDSTHWFTLFSNAVDRLCVVGVSLADATLVELSVSFSRRDSLTGFCFQVVRKQQLRDLQWWFDWNASCAHALALYQWHGVILDAQLQQRALLINSARARYASNRQHENGFRHCAVSAHSICIVSIPDLRRLDVFDLNGVMLTSLCDDSSAICRAPYYFVLLDNPDEPEILLFSTTVESRATVVFSRIRSGRKQLARQRCTAVLSLYDARTLDLDSVEQACKRLPAGSGVDKQLLIEDCLHTMHDLKRPQILAVVAIAPDYFFLDSANNAVKRWTARHRKSQLSSISTLYTPDVALAKEQRLTGMCVLDEQTLIVVRANCHLDHVNVAQARCVHSVRFTKFRRSIWNYHSRIVLMDSNRLFVAVTNDSFVFEIECERECANWRLTKLHKLPSGWKVRHINCNARSRSCGLVCERSGRSNGDEMYRVSVFNERFVESATLPLPPCRVVFYCILESGCLRCKYE